MGKSKFCRRRVPGSGLEVASTVLEVCSAVPLNVLEAEAEVVAKGELS